MKSKTQERSYEYYLPRFNKLDPEEAVKRAVICFDTEASRFTLDIFGYTVYAEWPEFKLVPADPKHCPKTVYGFQMQILIIRFLLEGAYAPAGGGFKAYRELPWGELYDANFQGRCIKRFAYGFGYKPDAFRKAAEILGGKELSLGDISYDFSFIGGVTCRVILWTPDEEFPPSAQFLFSDNTPAAFNAEDLAVVGDVIISTLKEVSAAK